MAKKTKLTPTVSSPVGVYVYLGPTIHGVIQNGTIFKGAFEDVCKRNLDAIKRFPDIRRFIVKDTEVSKVKASLKEGENFLSNAYKKIISQIQGG